MMNDAPYPLVGLGPPRSSMMARLLNSTMLMLAKL